MKKALVFCFVLAIVGGCSLPICEGVPKPILKNDRLYGVTTRVDDCKWWDVYEKGLSFHQGGFLHEAETCFRWCISRKDEDALWLETSSNVYTHYHFWWKGYFPRGQLGIVLFEQGRIEEAKRELQASIDSIQSTKDAHKTEFLKTAQEYLERCQ